MGAKRIYRAINAILLTIYPGHCSTAPTLPLQDNTLGMWSEEFAAPGGISYATNAAADGSSVELKL